MKPGGWAFMGILRTLYVSQQREMLVNKIKLQLPQRNNLPATEPAQKRTPLPEQRSELISTNSSVSMELDPALVWLPVGRLMRTEKRTKGEP